MDTDSLVVTQKGFAQLDAQGLIDSEKLGMLKIEARLSYF